MIDQIIVALWVKHFANQILDIRFRISEHVAVKPIVIFWEVNAEIFFEKFSNGLVFLVAAQVVNHVQNIDNEDFFFRLHQRTKTAVIDNFLVVKIIINET